MSELVAEALRLYDAGLHVFPIPLGSKKPYGATGYLQTTRLSRDDLARLVPGSNIAVMTGRHSKNLLVLDCDTTDAYNHVSTELSNRNLVPWTRSSDRGGQFWLRCADGEVANGTTNGIDILGNRKYTVAPPSMHPNGTTYTWVRREGNLPSVIALAQIDFLPLRLAGGSRRASAPPRKRGLPPVADAVLVQRDISGYRTNSEAEFAACLSLIGAGHTDSQILDAFRRWCPSHYAKVGEANFRRYVLNAALVQHNAEQSSIQEEHRTASDLVQWAQARPWPGRTGATDRAVFMALCERQRCEGAATFRASCREVAEAAGINKETAQTAIGRLIAQGYILGEGICKLTGAGLYSLPPQDGSERAVIRTLYTYSLYALHSVRITAPSALDAFHRRALGKTALQVYENLQIRTTSTVADLVESTGKSRRTVRNALARLEGYHLAMSDGEGWHSLDVTDDVLEKIAVACGTLGAADRRTTEHQAQRQTRAGRLLTRQKALHSARGPNRRSAQT